jgi:hypothetical protein
VSLKAVFLKRYYFSFLHIIGQPIGLVSGSTQTPLRMCDINMSFFAYPWHFRLHKPGVNLRFMCYILYWHARRIDEPGLFCEVTVLIKAFLPFLDILALAKNTLTYSGFFLHFCVILGYRANIIGH